MSTEDPRQTFFAEARDLLADMESSLLLCEHGATNAEVINALFRAAHTIKGSSGLVGFEPIVDFTHHVETVLDRVRAGTLTLDSSLSALLLCCKDHMQALVECAAGGGNLDSPEQQARGSELAARLAAAAGESAAASVRDPAAPASACGAPAAKPEAAGNIVASDCWHISVRFNRDVLRHGMDPLSFIRYLTTFGELASVEIVDEAMPAANEFDPQCCYLGFEIRFKSAASKERIEGAFEFVRDDCTLHIVAPRSRLAEYVALLSDLPESNALLGELLVRCGTLTRRELDKALALQESFVSTPTSPKPRIGEILIENRMVAPAVVEAALNRQPKEKEQEQRTLDTRSIRVDASKLERLIDLIGELIIAGASTNLLAREAQLPELNESAFRLERLVEAVRDQALELRMVQIGATFVRFQRVVRDVARELGKQIRLEISGAETEFDKTLVERINDPLMHLVRNAIDHGIEDAETRKARGKPPEGVVYLKAFHDSGAVAIEVSDDGGGLNRERILAKALERGLISDAHSLSDSQVCGLIFEPGFSTASAVTNLSGRGVGMDVVKRNITALRGTVDVDSQEGVGTTVRIRLPLTLAIIDGFQVRVGAASFVIPLDMVEECVELNAEDQEHGDDNRYINLRGRPLPFIRLRELFGVEGTCARRESVVVVKSGGRQAGIVVDELLGELQTVIKPLSRLFRSVGGVGGSTILGNGRVALILDIPSLVQRSLSGPVAASAG